MADDKGKPPDKPVLINQDRQAYATRACHTPQTKLQARETTKTEMNCMPSRCQAAWYCMQLFLSTSYMTACCFIFPSSLHSPLPGPGRSGTCCGCRRSAVQPAAER